MQDLGTLPGGTDAVALVVNERGEVAGTSYTSSAPSLVCSPSDAVVLTTGAFIWDKKNGMRDLGGFGGTCTGAAGLNNKGQVAGRSFRTGDKSAAAFFAGKRFNSRIAWLVGRTFHRGFCAQRTRGSCRLWDASRGQHVPCDSLEECKEHH